MTIDQAICILRNTAWLGSNDERDETEQAVEMVIDKLLSAEKAQLSGEDATKDATYDSISRKEATTIPVMPKEHREYQTMNLDDAYEQGWFDCQKCIEELPSAEPERKTGKWIDETFKPWGLVYHPYKCDQCGEHSEADSNFCPNCGAYMIGEKEETE